VRPKLAHQFRCAAEFGRYWGHGGLWQADWQAGFSFD